jgi:hypothetical protein
MDKGYAKVEVRTPDGYVETVWAQRTTPDRDEFRIG